MKVNELKKKLILKIDGQCFNEIIKIEDFYFSSVLIDQKSYKNILIYGIEVTMKLDILFGFGKYDIVYNRIRYLI